MTDQPPCLTVGLINAELKKLFQWLFNGVKNSNVNGNNVVDVFLISMIFYLTTFKVMLYSNFNFYETQLLLYEIYFCYV